MYKKTLLLALVVLLVLLHVSIPTATDATARSIIRLIVPRSSVEPVLHAWDCSIVRPVFSADGALAALLPGGAACATSERIFRSASLSDFEAEQMRPYFEAMEGEYQASWETISGINLKGWILAPYRLFKFGGSNPLETGIKNLRGMPGNLSVPAKLDNAFRTVAFTAYFLPDPISRDKFVAETVPCARGSIGSHFRVPVAGNLCPLVLFDKRAAEELTPPERCYWAASAQRLVRVVGPDTPAVTVETANAVAKQIQDRARSCISKIGIKFGWTDEQIQDKRAAIAHLKVPSYSQTNMPPGLE